MKPKPVSMHAVMVWKTIDEHSNEAISCKNLEGRCTQCCPDVGACTISMGASCYWIPSNWSNLTCLGITKRRFEVMIHAVQHCEHALDQELVSTKLACCQCCYNQHGTDAGITALCIIRADGCWDMFQSHLVMQESLIRHWTNNSQFSFQLSKCFGASNRRSLAWDMIALPNHLLFRLQLASNNKIMCKISSFIFLTCFSNMTFNPVCNCLRESQCTLLD